jgi:lipooligosaccharide transport system permease protein
MARALAVLEFHLVGYRSTWRGSVLGSFVMPVLYVLGFGFGVGHFVDAGGQLGPVRYLDYIVPGLLAMTAMNVAFGESAWPVLSRFKWIRVYHSMVATPLRVRDILGGGMLFVLFRLVVTATVFLAVTAAFGAVHSLWAVTVPLTCALLGLAVALPIHAFAAAVDVDSYFALLMRFAIVPLGLFSAVFFPITALPVALQRLAWLSPLWHAVELCRAATLPGTGMTWPAALAHVAYLGIWTAAGYWLAVRTFSRRLAI